MTETSPSSPSSWKLQSPYKQEFGDTNDRSAVQTETKIYSASCYCGRVRYEVRGDPESSKNCHCRGCQQLHGAPFEWVSIFYKQNVRFDAKSLDYLYFYNGEMDVGWEATVSGQDRCLPVKVSCTHCRTPIADEGRNMWLAFTTLFGFTIEGDSIPAKFEHSCHLFYSQRCVDLNDNAVKWEGHKNKSKKWGEEDS